MRFVISILLIALASFAAGLFLPWYSLAIMSFLVIILIPQSPWSAFLAGFLGVGLLWGIHSAVISHANNDVLAHRISQLFLKTDSPLLLVIVTALIGGLVAGFAALTASYARRRPATSV
jgi:hypothetical protein